MGGAIWSLGCAFMAWVIQISPHTTSGGVLGFDVPAACITLFASLCIEMCDVKKEEGRPNRIYKWRQARRKPSALDKWRLAALESSEHDTCTKVYIQSGDKKRLIGSADPIKDMDGFMDLKAQAEQAAEVYNMMEIR